MTPVNNTTYTHGAYQNNYQYDAAGAKKNDSGIRGASAGKTWAAPGEKLTELSGAGTYGKPQLSEKGLEYYNSLVKKYGHMDFVLVSADKKREAEMMKGSFAGDKAITVLIDTDKIEQMARDESVRAKYEGILKNAKSGLEQLQARLASSGTSGVQAFGMSVGKDGRASFFAVMDKSMASQRERQVQRQEEKAKAKKADAKKAEKEKDSQRAERNGRNERSEKNDRTGRNERWEDDTVTLTADSLEGLVNKIQNFYQQGMFSNVRTEEEMQVGSQFNFGV